MINENYSAAPITTEALAVKLLTVGQVCDCYPGKRGRRLAPSTVTRWILGGCPGLGGQRVRLRATRCGSRWLISPADLSEFFAALAAPPSTPPPPSPSQRDDPRERAARAAESCARRGA